MNKLSVMTLGFLKETLFPFRADRDREGLEARYTAFFRDVKAAGFSGVDLASFEVSLLGETFLSETLGSLSLGIASLIHIDCFADETGREECLKRSFAALETAKRLSSPVLMLVPESAPPASQEQVHAALAASFAPVCARAAELGIVPVFEDFPDRSLYSTRLEEVKALMACVEGLKLVFDSGNTLFGGEEPLAYLKGLSLEDIGYVHIKDVVIREELADEGERLSDGRRVDAVPTGEGIIPIAAIMRELDAKGYRGGCCVEAAPKEGVSRLKGLKTAREYILNAMGE